MILAAALVAVSMVAAPACTVDDAQLTWGFKESFRAYIDGSIANGEWSVADGATYETPSFGWSDGTGEVPGTVAFTGSIEFTGHGGILDTTVADPRIVFDGSDTAVLVLDVSGTTQEGTAVDAPAVDFATIDVSGGVIGAPVTLTAEGAAAFGTYPAGEPLDPITLELPGECSVGGGQAGSLVAVSLAAGLAIAATLILLLVRRRRLG